MDDELIVPGLDERLREAQQSLCSGGCQRTWDQAGGGWLDMQDERPTWRCQDCVEPCDLCTCSHPGCRNRLHVTVEQMHELMSKDPS